MASSACLKRFTAALELVLRPTAVAACLEEGKMQIAERVLEGRLAADYHDVPRDTLDEWPGIPIAAVHLQYHLADVGGHHDRAKKVVLYRQRRGFNDAVHCRRHVGAARPHRKQANLSEVVRAGLGVAEKARVDVAAGSLDDD